MKKLFYFVIFTSLFSHLVQRFRRKRRARVRLRRRMTDAGQIKTFEVRLPVTVVDKKKKKDLVTGLSRGDFSVFEDGVQQEVTFFSDEKTNPPIYVGVLMDTSPSTAGKLKFSKEAAKNFIYTVTRLRKDKAAFMTFDNEVQSASGFYGQTRSARQSR